MERIMAVVMIKETSSVIFVLEQMHKYRGRDAHLYGGEDVIDIGLGMKPALTGKGMGKEFFQAGIAFATKEFNAKMFRLSVATFNTRAITLYKNIGFKQGPIF